MAYSKEIEVRWSDLDANGHVTHTAYANFATHTRVAWLSEIGFPVERILSFGIQGVLLKESLEYYREVFLNEKVTVKVHYAGAALDGARWKFRQEIYKANGKLAVVDTVLGAWISQETRRMTPPPAEFLTALDNIPKTADFEIIGKR